MYSFAAWAYAVCTEPNHTQQLHTARTHMSLRSVGGRQRPSRWPWCRPEPLVLRKTTIARCIALVTMAAGLAIVFAPQATMAANVQRRWFDSTTAHDALVVIDD